MAFSSFNASLDATTPTTYTVPMGKVAAFTFTFEQIGAGSLVLTIDGKTVLVTASFFVGKPLVASAGQVIAVGGTGAVGAISGLLFDSTSTTFNAQLTTVGPDTYTVPANKLAIFNFIFGSIGSGSLVLQVGGVTVATLTTLIQIKPVTAAAGEVVSVGGTTAVGYVCGILIDV